MRTSAFAPLPPDHDPPRLLSACIYFSPKAPLLTDLLRDLGSSLESGVSGLEEAREREGGDERGPAGDGEVRAPGRRVCDDAEQEGREDVDRVSGGLRKSQSLGLAARGGEGLRADKEELQRDRYPLSEGTLK